MYTRPLFTALTTCLLPFYLPLAQAQSAPFECGNPGETGGDDGCEGCSCEIGNSSQSELGPEMKIPSSSSGYSPKSGQTFLTPYDSSGRSIAIDLVVNHSVGEKPLEMRRYYQSRSKSGTRDLFGHGLTWSHSHSIAMTSKGVNTRRIVMPDGLELDFTTVGGTTNVDGTPRYVFNPSKGKGQRLYQGQGADIDIYTLILQNGFRYVFERVSTLDGVFYHPRYHADSSGRRLTYLTDSLARVTRVTDEGGNSLTFSYGTVQVNRKSSVLLHEITTAPASSWNVVNIPESTPFRYFQVISAKDSFFNLLEVEFIRPDGNMLTGGIYGTPQFNLLAPTETFENTFDGDIATGYLHPRSGSGIAGLDLGLSNEQTINKIRYQVRTGKPGSVSLGKLAGTRFEGVFEAPEFIDVLQRVESSDGRAVNYLYDTVVDETIGQSHLVLSGVDYDDDGTALAATDARFTYVINPGHGPSVETFYEPRSTHEVQHMKFEYHSGTFATRGMVAAVKDAVTGALIVSNTPETTRKLELPGEREIEITYGDGGVYTSVKNAEGNETTYTYNEALMMTSSTDPAGRTTTYERNVRGQQTRKTRPDGHSSKGLYDSAGRLYKVIESAPGYPDRVTLWHRNAQHRIIRKTYPDGSFEKYTYNALGLVTKKRQRNGAITARTYDATGLVLDYTEAAGTPQAETTIYTYYGVADPTGSPARYVKTETDPRGRTTSYVYDNRGQKTQTTYPDGSSRTVTYDPFGNKIAETDGIATQSWTYNGFNKLTTMTDPLGHFTQYYYGEGGVDCGCFTSAGPTMTVSAEGRLTLREYDALWRISRETIGHASPEAATTEYLYDLVGNLAMKILPGGVTETYTHDVGDRVLTSTITGPDGLGGNLSLTSSRTYSPLGETLTSTAPGNRTSSMTYDVMGRTVTSTDPLGTVMAYTYDAADNRTSVTEDSGGPLARTTAMAYDLHNRPVSTTYPDATTTSQTYHPGGDTATVTNELGRTASNDTVLTTWTDSKGNNWTSFVSTTIDPLGNISSTHPAPMAIFGGTTMSVSAMGRISESHANPDGTTAETITGLTAAGSTIAQDGTVTTYTYDDDHLPLTQTTDPTGLNLTSTSTYDARGNRLTSTDPLNRTTTSQYDLRGNVTKTILPDARENTYVYDALNRRITSTDPKNQTITNGYWYETGIQATLKDARNNITTWTINDLGQILTKAYPNGDTHSYTYDSLHRMLTHTTPKNEVCTYTYDLRDRQLKTDWNTATPDTTKTYFANGLLKSIDNTISKSDYAYSLRNELTPEIQTLWSMGFQPVPRTVSYTYDADGLRLQMNSPSGSPVDYTWTAKAQLADISRDGPPPLATYSYDKASRLISTAHENGITEAKTYNAASELLANLHKQGGTTVSGHGYTLDTTSRRTAETFPGTSTAPRTYGYDTADQVTSADYGGTLTDAYAYDAMGNRTSATVASQAATFSYSANSANQYTSVTGFAPITHDANGNLLTQNGATYTWDSENRLLSVTNGTTTNTFTYDGQHRRVTKRTAVNGTVTEKTHYIYDGWNVIEEYANTDTMPGFNLTTFALAKTLTWGTDLSGSLQGAGGVGGLLLTTDHGSLITSHFYHYDGNGNVIEVTDNAGTKAATYRYDAFGNTLVATGPYAATNKYRFSTKPIDAEVAGASLYYYGYRYYDPVTGRWPSRDPIEEEGGMNLYGFVGSSPTNAIDMYGLCESMSNISGFSHWLFGFGAYKNVCWDTFDPQGSTRDILKGIWKTLSSDRVEAECAAMDWNTSKDISIYNKYSQLFKAPIAWINLYWGDVYGETTNGAKNVSLWKVKDQDECYCSGVADIILKARDRSDFNPGGAFKALGITFQDNYFLWLQRNSPLGWDYNISDFERAQVDWHFEY